MITSEHQPISQAERRLRDRLAEELTRLIGGRPTAEAVALLECINAGMEAKRAEQQAAAAAEMITVH